MLGDIGRQGHQADFVQDVVDILICAVVVFEADEAVAFLHHTHDLARHHALTEHQAVTDACALAGFDQALPGVQLMLAEQE